MNQEINDPKRRPSKYSIERDGKKILLTNGEVLEATTALLHRMAEDALHRRTLVDVLARTRPSSHEEAIGRACSAVGHRFVT